MKTMKVKLTFTEDVLGTASGDPKIHETYIASNAPDAPSREEEVAAIGVDESIEKQKTVFPKDKDGNPFIWDYQIKGFFKDAAQAFNYIGGKYKLTNYKKKIDDLVFIDERRVWFIMPDGGEIGDCQRPLRCETAKGPRVALANSETVPAGTTITFTIRVLTDDLMGNIVDYLDYGRLKGIGQWRNSSKGRFSWTELDEEGNATMKTKQEIEKKREKAEKAEQEKKEKAKKEKKAKNTEELEEKDELEEEDE